MADLLQATQDAAFAMLNTAIQLPLAAVKQHTLENDQPPLVIVGDLDAESAGGKGGYPDKITFDIVTISRQPGRRYLLAIMAAVRAALDQQQMSADGVNFSPAIWLSSETSIAPDGVTYAGIQRFQVFAEPA